MSVNGSNFSMYRSMTIDQNRIWNKIPLLTLFRELIAWPKGKHFGLVPDLWIYRSEI